MAPGFGRGSVAAMSHWPTKGHLPVTNTDRNQSARPFAVAGLPLTLMLGQPYKPLKSQGTGLAVERTGGPLWPPSVSPSRTLPFPPPQGIRGSLWSPQPLIRVPPSSSFTVRSTGSARAELTDVLDDVLKGIPNRLIFDLSNVKSLGLAGVRIIDECGAGAPRTVGHCPTSSSAARSQGIGAHPHGRFLHNRGLGFEPPPARRGAIGWRRRSESPAGFVAPTVADGERTASRKAVLSWSDIRSLPDPSNES